MIPADQGHLASREVSKEALAQTSSNGVWPATEWWKSFGDDQLDGLMTLALSHSPSLDTANARLKVALASIDQVRASAGMNLVADASVSHEYESANYIFPPPLAGNWLDVGRVALDFSYDFDWWGRNRANLQAAIGQSNAAQAERAAANVALTSAVAQTYYAWQVEAARQSLLKQQLGNREAIVAKNQKRLARGLDPITVKRQSEFEMTAIRQALVMSNTNMRLAENQLRALVGSQTPVTLAPASIPKVEGNLPANIGLDLLAHRPDIQAARLRVESALHHEEEAKAGFYPDFKLTAFAGFTSVALKSLLQSPSRTAGIAPAIDLPIFDAGRLKANLGSARANIDVAIAQYNQSIVDAVKEVADQLVTIESIDRQVDTVQQALTAAKQIESAVKAREQRGLADETVVLGASLPVLAQEDQTLQLSARKLNAQLMLTRALGGGYNAAAAK